MFPAKGTHKIWRSMLYKIKLVESLFTRYDQPPATSTGSRHPSSILSQISNFTPSCLVCIMMKYVAIFLGAALTMAAAERGRGLRSTARRLQGPDEEPPCCGYQKVCNYEDPDAENRICDYMCIKWCGYTAAMPTDAAGITVTSDLGGTALRHDGGQGTVRRHFVVASSHSSLCMCSL